MAAAKPNPENLPSDDDDDDLNVYRRREQMNNLICSACKYVEVPARYEKKIVCHECCINCQPKSIDINSNLECKYKDYGCEVIVNRVLYSYHINECKFGQIICQYCTQKTEIHINEFIKHLKDVHSVDGEDTDQNMHSHLCSQSKAGFTKAVVHFTTYFKYDGNYFIANAKVIKNKWSNWFSIIGTKEEAKKYEVNVTLSNSTDNIDSKRIREEEEEEEEEGEQEKESEKEKDGENVKQKGEKLKQRGEKVKQKGGRQKDRTKEVTSTQGEKVAEKYGLQEKGEKEKGENEKEVVEKKWKMQVYSFKDHEDIVPHSDRIKLSWSQIQPFVILDKFEFKDKKAGHIWNFTYTFSKV